MTPVNDEHEDVPSLTQVDWVKPILLVVIFACVCFWLNEFGLIPRGPSVTDAPPPVTRAYSAGLGEIAPGVAPGWMARHSEINTQVAASKLNPPRVLLLGDSITEQWNDAGKDAFKEYLGGFRTLNAGINGDQLGALVWRVRGEGLSGLSPDVVVVAEGTNNIFNAGTNSVANAVLFAADTAHERWPKAKIIVVSIFPRAYRESPTAPVFDPAGINKRIAAVNTAAKTGAEQKGYIYADLAPLFTAKDGGPRTELFRDGLHPNEKGYAIYGAALRPVIEKALN